MAVVYPSAVVSNAGGWQAYPASITIVQALADVSNANYAYVQFGEDSPTTHELVLQMSQPVVGNAYFSAAGTSWSGWAYELPTLWIRLYSDGELVGEFYTDRNHEPGSPTAVEPFWKDFEIVSQGVWDRVVIVAVGRSPLGLPQGYPIVGSLGLGYFYGISEITVVPRRLLTGVGL